MHHGVHIKLLCYRRVRSSFCGIISLKLMPVRIRCRARLSALAEIVAHPTREYKKERDDGWARRGDDDVSHYSTCHWQLGRRRNGKNAHTASQSANKQTAKIRRHKLHALSGRCLFVGGAAGAEIRRKCVARVLLEDNSAGKEGRVTCLHC